MNGCSHSQVQYLLLQVHLDFPALRLATPRQITIGTQTTSDIKNNTAPGMMKARQPITPGPRLFAAKGKKVSTCKVVQEINLSSLSTVIWSLKPPKFMVCLCVHYRVRKETDS